MLVALQVFRVTVSDWEADTNILSSIQLHKD